MTNIREAKKHLREQYRYEDGFVGIGITELNNEEALCIYVNDPASPAAQQLKRLTEFEGFPLEVEVSGEVKALPASVF